MANSMPWEDFQGASAPAQSGMPWDDFKEQPKNPQMPQPNEGFWDYQKRQFLGPDSIMGGMARGAAQQGIGTLQLAQDVGKSLYGPLPSDQPEMAAYNATAQKLAKEGEGTGVKGAISEAVGTPLNYVPGMGLGTYGLISGLTAPQTNDTGLGGRAVQGAVEAPVMMGVGQVGKYIGKGAQYLANKTGLTDAIASGLQKFGMTGNGSDLYNLAQSAGLDVSGKGPQEIADNLQKWYESQASNLASNISPAKYDPVEAARGIASNWSAAQKGTNEAYTAAKEVGANVQQPMEGLPGKLDSMIGSLEGNTAPGTKEHAALAQLKYIRDQIAPQSMIPGRSQVGAPTPGFIAKAGTEYQPDLSGMALRSQGEPIEGAEGAAQRVMFEPTQTAGNITRFPATPARNIDLATGKPIAPTVSGADLVDLRATLNKGFNPKKLPDSAMLPAYSAQNDVRGALEAAGEANPEFGAKLTAADQAQQQLGQTFKKNDLLKSFFKPEDLMAFEQNAKSGTPLPDITLQRANQMLSKVETPEALNTLTKAMPQEAGDALKAAKVQQLFDQAGFDAKKLSDPDFMRLMSESLGNDPEALKQLSKVQQVADVLERRKINPMAVQTEPTGHAGQSNWLRAAWDLFEGRKAYAIRMTYRALTDSENAGLTGLQSEIAKGAPLRNVLPGIGQQILPRVVAPQLKGQAQPEPAAATGGIGDQNMQELQNLKQQMPAAPTPQTNNADQIIQKFAKAESDNKANAKNPNSSASGPYQFTDMTWAQMVKKYGKDTGITLQDKANPQAQQIMAKLLAKDNIAKLQSSLGRMPTLPEVYLAHVFGPDGATRLIQAQGTGKQAMLLYPRAVTTANHSIFFNGNTPRTVEEVYNILAKKVA